MTEKQEQLPSMQHLEILSEIGVNCNLQYHISDKYSCGLIETELLLMIAHQRLAYHCRLLITFAKSLDPDQARQSDHVFLENF